MNSNEAMIQSLIREGVLKTPEIIAAFRAIDRRNFVQPETAAETYENHPLPIGEGQTISQPYTVAFMLELLAPQPGMHILDIGAGSGWQTALLAHIVGESGKITAIERIPALCEFAKENIEKYEFLSMKRVEFFCGDAASHLPPQTVSNTYDAIIAAATAKELPDLWRKAVKTSGKIIAPIGNSLWVFTKKDVGSWEDREYPGFVFVPLIRDAKPLLALPLPAPAPKNQKQLLKKFLLSMVVFTFAFSLMAAWEIYIHIPQYDNTKTIDIAKGDGLRSIAATLKKEGIIRSQWVFIFYTILQDNARRIQAGTYTFSPLPLANIEQELTRGGSSITIVIPEGWTVGEIEALLLREKISNKEEFHKLAAGENLNALREKFSFLGAIPAQNGLEGFLFPDTYNVLKTMPAAEIAELMLKNFDSKLSPALRQEITRQNKTVFQVVTISSLIEKEVVSNEDRAIVSGILWKRMSLGIPLQVDATISYIKKQRGLPAASNGKISTADTKIDSPYNTYKYTGLPKGPIGNPGLSAIKAAIYPKASPYLYYLSTPEGKTIFSKTLEEHNTAKVKYLR